jgi:hypothetical protein
MAEPIYRIVRDEKGVRAIPPVERQRLLSPTEREEARRKREEARRKVEERTDERSARKPLQDHGGGVDYSA